MKGKQLKGLVKVLSAFNDEMDTKVDFINDDKKITVCQIKPKSGDIFGVPLEGVLYIKPMTKMDFTNDMDYDVSVDNDRYIVECDQERYQFTLYGDETIKVRSIPKIDYDHSFAIPVTELKQAMKKCAAISDKCRFKDGRMEAEGNDMKISILLRMTPQEGSTSIYIKHLKKILNVAKGIVLLSYGEDLPVRIRWADEYYEYDTLIAPLVEND